MPRPRAHAPNKQGGKPAGQDTSSYNQMAVKIAKGLIAQGYADVQSSDCQVNFIHLKRQNIVVKKV